VRLYSRPGNDLTRRFPLIVDALARLRSRSCIIDGEAVACDDNGVASFDLVRHHRANDSVFLYAFDLIELNGDDLRRDPLEVRKATLASIVAKAGPGIRFNEHIERDGPTVFAHACKMGLEGIVSKRKDSAYRSGRSPDWLKMKNPAAAGHDTGGRGGLEQKEMTVGATMDDDPQELLTTARHHCQAIQTIIDQLTETKSNTELRLLSQRLQRLAFHAAPRSGDG
jgi:ATP-dependent DNA ligase